jgi:hypothetical protein
MVHQVKNHKQVKYDMAMQPDNIGDIIATRVLSKKDAPELKIVVKMGKPRPLANATGTDFYCPIQITGIGKEKVMPVAGVDAFQAIELGFKIIGARLAALNKEHGGQLRWEGSTNGGLGFPIPNALTE